MAVEGSLTDRESMVGEAERRVEEDLRGREETLRSVPLGAQYRSEAEQELFGEGKRASVLAERDMVVTRVEQRLGRELDSREEALVSSAGSNELLVAAFSELCAGDPSFGDGSSLLERSQVIALAERRLEDDRAEDAERSAALDDLEAMLKETSSGAQYLAAPQQEVLGEGKEPATLHERDSVVMTAWRRVEQELDGREQALAARRCEDGPVEVSGAWLYAIKLTELEAGQQENDGPSPGCREQALAWAAQSSGDSRWGRLSTARHQPHAAVVRISGAWTATTTAGPANGKVDCRRPPGGRAAVTISRVLPGRSGRDRDRLLTQGHQGRGGIGWLSPAE